MLGVMGFDKLALDFATEDQAASLVGEAVAAQHMALALFPMICVVNVHGLFAAA